MADDFVSPIPARQVAPEVEEKTAEETPVVEPVVEEEKPKKTLPKFLLLIPVIILAIVIVSLVVNNIRGKTIKNGQVTLQYWGLWEDASIMEGVIADFEKANPGIKINYTKNQKINYRTRLQGRLAKDPTIEEVPDVFRIHSSWLPMVKADLAKVPGGVANSVGLETDFYDVYKRDLKVGGNYMAIPLMYDGLALFYNKELMEAIAAKPPRTWWDLKTTAEKLTVKSETGIIKVAGAALGMADNVDHWSDVVGLLMRQMGVDVWSKDSANLKKMEEVLTFYTNFKTNYGVWDESFPDSTTSFASGKLGFYFAPSWRVFNLAEMNPNLRYEIVAVPQLPTSENVPVGQELPEESLTNTQWATYWAEGVNVRSKKQAEAWKFLTFLASKEALQKMYTTASQIRAFGEIYPRKSMAEMIASEAKIKPFLTTANLASSGILASRTFDDGINDELSAYFKDAINGILFGNKTAKDVIETLNSGIDQIANKYKITSQ
jgi:multiple sugar transport system substrate-binding protein